MSRLFLIIFGIIFTLLIIEVYMQVSGFVYLKNRHNHLSNSRKTSPLRILCLGDSYTFGVGVKKEESYPYQLQQILNKPDVKNEYMVINRGIPGRNSSSLAYNFRSDINTLNPGIVIVLIGNNDIGIFTDIDSRFRLKSLALYKNIFFGFLKNPHPNNNFPEKKQWPLHSSVSTSGLEQEISRLICSGNEFRDKNLYDEAIACYKQALKLDPQHIRVNLELLRTLKFAHRFQEAINTAFDLIGNAQATRDIYIESANIFQIIRDGWKFIDYAAHWQKDNPKEGLLIPNAAQVKQYSKHTLQYLMKKAHTLYRAHLYNQAFDCYREIFKLFQSKLLFEKEVFYECPDWVKYELLTMISHGIANALLLKNLSDIIDLCNSQNIKLIILSYPEYLPPATAYMAQDRQIPLLDIRPIFEQYRNTALRDKYLLLSGHCTALGNKLVAEYIADYIVRDTDN